MNKTAETARRAGWEQAVAVKRRRPTGWRRFEGDWQQGYEEGKETLPLLDRQVLDLSEEQNIPVKSARLQLRRRHILELLAGSPKPLSVRNIFYQMVAKKGYRKIRSEYVNIDNDLVEMRWDGQVPFRWIADTSRERVGATSKRDWTAQGSVSMWLRQTPTFTSVWKPLGLHPQVWVESRSTAGMLESLCDKYEVGLWPCGGHPSLSLLRDGALENPTHIAILTDYDDEGQTILTNIERDLARFDRLPEVENLAVTDWQITEWSLPTSFKPAKKDADIQEPVELEAIEVTQLLEIVEGWILGLLPEGGWEAYEERRQATEDEVAEIVETLTEQLEDEEEMV